VPYGREGDGLHLPPVPEALNRACPDIKYPAQRMSLCEALFSTWSASIRVGIKDATLFGRDRWFEFVLSPLSASSARSRRPSYKTGTAPGKHELMR
jgi:hypothetical protein